MRLHVLSSRYRKAAILQPSGSGNPKKIYWASNWLSELAVVSLGRRRSSPLMALIDLFSWLEEWGSSMGIPMDFS
jgi:hypothetical protein